MTRKRRLTFGVAGVVLAVAAVLGWLAKRTFESGMFEPGSVAARVAAAGESLNPPPTDARADAWNVTPDVQLFHESLGAGPDLVLVHGGPGYAPAALWKVATPLATRFRVHMFHARGCGRSTRPLTRAPGSSTWDRMRAVEGKLGLAEQIADIERIRRRLGAERLVVVGHSFGALVGALYAAEWPERVSTLVLVSPAPLVVMPKTEGPDLFATVRARLPPARAGAFDAAMKDYFDLGGALAEDEPTLAARYGHFRDFYMEAMGEAPAAAPSDASDVGGFLTVATYASLGKRHDWRGALGRIRARTLVVHGATDLQPESDSRAVALAIGGAELEVLTNAGHFLPDEAPDALALAVLRTVDGK